jgi:hypothetical protein
MSAPAREGDEFWSKLKAEQLNDSTVIDDELSQVSDSDYLFQRREQVLLLAVDFHSFISKIAQRYTQCADRALLFNGFVNQRIDIG